MACCLSAANHHAESMLTYDQQNCVESTWSNFTANTQYFINQIVLEATFLIIQKNLPEFDQ